MTTITQGVDGKIFGRSNAHLIALPQDRAVQGTMGTIGASAANLGAAVTIMAGGANNDAIDSEGGLILTWQTRDRAVAAAVDYRMKRWGLPRVGRIKNQAFIYGVDDPRDKGDCVSRVAMAFKTYFILKLCDRGR